MGRIYGNAGTVITQASLGSITYKVNVLDEDDVETEVATGTITISSAVYDTLQTSDPRWTKDTTGWNFIFVVPAATFTSANAGLRHRVDVRFVPASGEPFVQSFASTPAKSKI